MMADSYMAVSLLCSFVMAADTIKGAADKVVMMGTVSGAGSAVGSETCVDITNPTAILR